MFRQCVFLKALLIAVLMVPFGAALGQARTGTVKIGLTEPMSGDFAAIGTPPSAAVRLAVKEINDAGGFTIAGTTYRFQLIEADNRSQTAAAVAAMTKLVEDDKVKFVFGPTLGALAIQAQEITVPAKVIHFSAALTWQAGGLLTDPKKPMLFGTQNPVAAAARIDAEGFRQMGAKKIALMGQDDDTMKGTIPAFNAELKAAGMEVVTILFPPKTADYSSYVARAKGENVDGIYLMFPATTAPDVLRAVVDLNAAPKGFGGRIFDPALAVKTVLGKPLPFPFFTTNPIPSFEYPANAKIRTFTEKIKAFQPNLGGAQQSFVFFSYDYVYMLVEAMKRAGTVEDTARIAQTLTTFTYDGVAGKICYSKESRVAQLDGGLIFVRDGKIDSKSVPSPCK